MNFLLYFITLSIINVIFSTIKSLVTINGNRMVASIINGGYYAFYNIMIIYTVSDFPLWQKCSITFLSNVIGVWIVKYAEEKIRKDKLWLIKLIIPAKDFETVHSILNEHEIAHNYYNLGKTYVIDCYCNEKHESSLVVSVSKLFNGKTIALENTIKM